MINLFLEGIPKNYRLFAEFPGEFQSLFLVCSSKTKLIIQVRTQEEKYRYWEAKDSVTSAEENFSINFRSFLIFGILAKHECKSDHREWPANIL